MNRRGILSLSAIAALGFAMLPGSAISQQKSIKEQLVGTWTFVSALDVQPDGRKTDPWGPNPKGIFMFDGNGHFAQFIVRSDLPKFAAKTRDQGTAAENKAVMAGLVGSFGTYTVNESDKIVTTHVEGGAFPNLVGVDQKRSIVSLTADELKYSNPATSTGTTAEATWKRVK
jgi:Lipocalin-like domain